MGKELNLTLIKWRWHLLLLAITGITSTYFFHNYAEKKHIYSSTTQLNNIKQNKIDKISEYIYRAEKYILGLTSSPETIQAISEVKTSSSKFRAFIEDSQRRTEYLDALLIDTEGNVIFSIYNNRDLNTNLKTGPYKSSLLAQSFERVMMSTAIDLTDFGMYAATQKPTIFILAPIFFQKKLMGVLAIQLDHKKIYDIANDYTQLGETGEVVLTEKNNRNILFVNPLRHDAQAAFKRKLSMKSSNASAYIEASSALDGSGISQDYRNKETLMSWGFLPKINLGIIIKKDLSEINSIITTFRGLSYSFILLSTLLLMVAFWAILLHIKLNKINILVEIKELLSSIWKWNPNIVKAILLIFLCLNLSLITILSFQYVDIQAISLNKTQSDAKLKVQYATQQINHKLQNVKFFAHSIADDLSVGRLQPETLDTRITKDLIENSEILGTAIAYKKTNKLFAPYFSRNNGEIKHYQIEDYYDYTAVNEDLQSEWYINAITNGASWADPYFEKISKHAVIAYTVPFTKKLADGKKEIIGVVSVFYSLDTIKDFAAELGVGQTGYSFILSKSGRYIYHPIEEYVTSEKTISQLASELKNKKLAEIGEKAISGSRGLTKNFDVVTQKSSWVYYEPVQVTNWSLGIVFIEEESISSIEDIRHQQIWIFVVSILILATLIFLITGFHTGEITNIVHALLGYSILIGTGLSCLWFLIYSTSAFQYIKSTAVVSQVDINRFIEEESQKAKERNESDPIAIPTGLFISSIDFPDSNHAIITGYIWQKYHDIIHKDISRGVMFPQATDSEIKESYKQKIGEVETIGWNIKCNLFQKYSFNKYPFDIKNLEALIQHKDITQNILLVPDLESYRLITPTALPGISNKFNLSGFNIRKSFFSTSSFTQNVNFGIQNYARSSEKTRLIFNIAFKRHILDSFVVYLLPLLVILFSMFAILVVAGRHGSSVFHPISAYTALMFAVIILHRTLRTRFLTGEVLYIEYYFFFTYLSILLLVLYVVMVYTNEKFSDIKSWHNRLPRILYWPMQITAWFITTVMTFYN